MRILGSQNCTERGRGNQLTFAGCHSISEDDEKWPKKNVVGRQELEVRLDKEHISFETAKIGSLVDVQDSEDPEGLRVMYYLVQDLKVRQSNPACA